MSTSYGVAIILAVLSVVITVASGASALRAQQTLTAAADLTALSAAAVYLSGDADPCSIARVVARNNGAVLEGCNLSTADETVTVTVSRASITSSLASASRTTVTATAGPAD